MSAIDARWTWRHDWNGVGVILADSTETILRRLSAAYLEEARSAALVVLRDVSGAPVELAPVWFDGAKNNWFPDLDPRTSHLLPSFDRWEPFGGCGWLARGVEESALLDRGETLPPQGFEACRRLIEATPSLALCGGGRWVRVEAVPAVDGPLPDEHVLVAMLDVITGDGTFAPVGRVDDSASAPLWRRAQAAAVRGDADALRRLLSDAAQLYSPMGSRIVRGALLDLLAARVGG